VSNQAPHKPLLLLSVLDLFEQGETTSNLIELTPDSRGDLTLPFYYLRSEGFWHLLPKLGRETKLKPSAKLWENVVGARLDAALCELFCVRESREILRSVLVETYFVPGVRNVLFEQGAVNHEAFRYSEELLERGDKQTMKEALNSEKVYQPVREQGFRRAVVTAYVHRCALCGIRVQTIYGHTVVEAAHIVPWSVNYDDRPANGMALCRTCHWTFDEGLLRVAPSYEIFASAQLRVDSNLPGYLSSLEGRGIVRPSEEVYWPDLTSLQWHHKNIFRR